MEQIIASNRRKQIGRRIGIGVAVATLFLPTVVLFETNGHPRTDDASVRANLIEITPEVSGRLIQLQVKDNAYVRKGELLFLIDPRPYEYALQMAFSDQAALEQQINDQRRRIAAQNSAAEAAKGGLQRAHTGVRNADSGIDVAKATVVRTQATSATAEARLKLAKSDLKRIEPLLEMQYVTAEQVDQAHTAVQVAQGAFDETLAALTQALAQETQSILHQREARELANISQSQADQAMHMVDTVDTLLSLRAAKAAKVDSARLDLERCRVVAPFDAYVTNLNISEGAYARVGGPMFTLIDTRTWWVVANYRESKITDIRIGSPVDVYLMGHPDRKFHGIVESAGFGVTPEDARVVGGLPDVERTLNWVHLSARFPVRIRTLDPTPELFRIGTSAVTIVR